MYKLQIVNKSKLKVNKGQTNGDPRSFLAALLFN